MRRKIKKYSLGGNLNRTTNTAGLNTAITGAKIGSTLGPLGTVVGAGLGFAYGKVQEKKQNELIQQQQIDTMNLEKEQFSIENNNTILNYPTTGVKKHNFGYGKYGTKLNPNVKIPNSVTLKDGARLAVGDKHGTDSDKDGKEGVPVYENGVHKAEIEDGEVEYEGLVFSKRLMSSTGRTFADTALDILSTKEYDKFKKTKDKHQAKLEDKNSDKYVKGTANRSLETLNNPLHNLFEEQQQVKQQKGIKEEQTMAYGGNIKKGALGINLNTELKNDPTKRYSNVAVKDYQQALVNKGYNLDKFGIDNIFGDETSGSLNQFQIDNNIPTTGVFDEATHNVLIGNQNQNQQRPPIERITLPSKQANFNTPDTEKLPYELNRKAKSAYDNFNPIKKNKATFINPNTVGDSRFAELDDPSLLLESSNNTGTSFTTDNTKKEIKNQIQSIKDNPDLSKEEKDSQIAELDSLINGKNKELITKGKDFGNLAYRFADNVMNRNYPTIQKPQLLKGNKLKTNFEIGDNIRDINNNTTGMANEISRTMRQTGSKAANIQNLHANSIKAKSKLYQQKENIETQLENAEITRGNQEQAANTQITKQYNDEVFNRNMQQLKDNTQNVSNSVDDIATYIKDKNTTETDKQSILMIIETLNKGGVLDREYYDSLPPEIKEAIDKIKAEKE